MTTAGSRVDAVIAITFGVFSAACVYRLDLFPPEDAFECAVSAMAVLSGLSMAGPLFLIRRWIVGVPLSLTRGEHAWCFMAFVSACGLILALASRPHTLMWFISLVWIGVVFPMLSVAAALYAIRKTCDRNSVSGVLHWSGVALCILQFAASLWLWKSLS